MPTTTTAGTGTGTATGTGTGTSTGINLGSGADVGTGTGTGTITGIPGTVTPGGPTGSKLNPKKEPIRRRNYRQFWLFLFLTFSI